MRTETCLCARLACEVVGSLKYWHLRVRCAENLILFVVSHKHTSAENKSFFFADLTKVV